MRRNKMATKGIGPQGLGIKGHKGLWIGDASTSKKAAKGIDIKTKKVDNKKK
jgi:hypothetical protein